ncbi:FecR family protein [Pedobacter foliorum]|uniref:FecR family protein n=1 Tax=Pedobacter foliorum TaxID=2739058 RepID=UPI001565B3F6|nr:FecR family protein [Pedobacter foliorum]NRF40535.1 FecR family protein [Pedobacter foliorum]
MSNLEKEKILEILKKHYKGTTTPTEEEFLNAYFKIFEHNSDYTSELNVEEENKLNVRLKNKINQAIDQNEGNYSSTAKKLNIIWPAIAATLVFITFITFYSNRKATYNKPNSIGSTAAFNIPPGGNKAVLTLANGSKIFLTDADNGEISNKSGVKIIKTRDGELVYEITGKVETDTKALNTIETPRGGQYRINLPDGTKVWLNAESSLKFPITFESTGDRLVELTGEAYFEVAHNKNQPFIVKTSKQELEVLGTTFNINTYENESSTTTTLLEGSVKITHDKQVRVIKKGQQAKVKDEIKVGPAQEDAIAWKNGIISFTNADIKTIMRQVSRWYDINVNYEGEIPTRLFTGEVSRQANLSELIGILETSKIRFKFDNKTITVMP